MIAFKVKQANTVLFCISYILRSKIITIRIHGVIQDKEHISYVLLCMVSDLYRICGKVHNPHLSLKLKHTQILLVPTILCAFHIHTNKWWSHLNWNHKKSHLLGRRWCRSDFSPPCFPDSNSKPLQLITDLQYKCLYNFVQVIANQVSPIYNKSCMLSVCWHSRFFQCSDKNLDCEKSLQVVKEPFT